MDPIKVMILFGALSIADGIQLGGARLNGSSDACSASPCSPCATRSSSEKCRWKFQRYIPSELEQKWWKVAEEVGANPCLAMRTTFAKDFAKYKAAIADGQMAKDELLPEDTCQCESGSAPQRLDPTVFSRYEYENECTSEVAVSYIEPLAGVLRHPGLCEDFGATVLRKDWLVVDQWTLHKDWHPEARFFYFDAGASTWSDGLGGASQAWFDNVYFNKCAPFQGYWLWEVQDENPTQVFAEVPARAKPNYHWYNIPASDNKESADSPLYHIRSVARPDDYVVLKVDIDNNAVEEGLVSGLLHDPELLSLIDEFYWEHHINMPPMAKIWGNQISRTRNQKDSIEMFRSLREAGVRAHSWV